MATYSFTVKKGKYKLDLSSSDREFINDQFELWVKAAGAYARDRKAKECKELVNSQIRAEEEITKKNIDAQLANLKPSVQPIDEVAKDSVEKQKAVEEKTSKNLDIFYAPPKQETISEIQENSINTGVFDNILENSLNNPSTELSFKATPTIKKDNAFLNYINARKIEKKIDYLLLTAYYFTQFEQKPRFTLKQLNTKLMQNIAVIIDHSVLQEAINRDYIECLPDLTGLVGASEYRLTAYGEKVLFDE